MSKTFHARLPWIIAPGTVTSIPTEAFFVRLNPATVKSLIGSVKSQIPYIIHPILFLSPPSFPTVDAEIQIGAAPLRRRWRLSPPRCLSQHELPPSAAAPSPAPATAASSRHQAAAAASSPALKRRDLNRLWRLFRRRRPPRPRPARPGAAYRSGRPVWFVCSCASTDLHPCPDQHLHTLADPRQPDVTYELHTEISRYGASPSAAAPST
ncbi:hypothetical protein BS78_02G209900 [Paspalum vaginatum]|nr:hypothetical protein BS78_02G209900 [Paspalum vaginatum]